MHNNDKVSVNMFGKEKELRVFCTGDNKFDENGNYKDDNFELSKDEVDVLNWFVNNIHIEDYKQEILDYCNQIYSDYSDTEITADDIEDEINIYAIAINVRKNWKSNDGFIYPEISFYGDCQCDEENGICIGFRDKKYIGINSQDWTL